jgi:hypothetical protein
MFLDWARTWIRSRANRTAVARRRTVPACHHYYRPRLENLEGRNLPAPATFIATGADFGEPPIVNVYTPGGALEFSFYAYDPAFLGGVRVAVGDVTGDGIPDIITAPGPNGGPDVRVFGGFGLNTAGPTTDIIREFDAYAANFTGGVYVAAGDVKHTGYDDIITGAGAGGGPFVQVWDGKTAANVGNFNAYSPAFTGGVRVAAGDINADGYADIITSPGPGGGPNVRIFTGTTLAQVASFMAYPANFTGGVFVASGDVNGDGYADIVTAPGLSGLPFVNVYSGFNATLIRSFLAYSANFLGGVRLAVADVNGDGYADIITGAGPTGGPQVKVFDGATGLLLESYMAFPTSFTTGVFVGGG